jgi:hypothetical protein
MKIFYLKTNTYNYTARQDGSEKFDTGLYHVQPTPDKPQLLRNCTRCCILPTQQLTVCSMKNSKKEYVAKKQQMGAD